jgi:N-acetyl sugar amidotransferase
MDTYKKSGQEQQIFKIPKEVLWCKECVISNQRPRIIFNENGVCSGCINQKKKLNTDWKLREKELIELLNQHRSKNGSYDVLVPSSGGKDSAYVAHQLKYKYNMNPLTVTWSPLKYTNLGKLNLEAKIHSGFTNLLFTSNPKVNAKLARLCLEELGDAFHVFVLGQYCFPFHMAIKFNIKLVFYGENGEAEYAGVPEIEDMSYKPFEMLKSHHFKGSDIDELIEYGINNKSYLNKNDFNKGDLEFYKLPDLNKLSEENIKGKHFFSYYKNWIPQENFYYAVENTGYSPAKERQEGTYSRYASLDDKMDGFHYYLRYIKFGLGRCTEDASHEIRDGHISRDEGLNLVKKYDGEFPQKYFTEFLDYLNLNKEEFYQIVDSWRPDHLWKKNRNGWELKNPII